MKYKGEKMKRQFLFEKVNPSHPDKIADRIAGAIVDLAYTREERPRCAVEILLGHGECNIIIESDIEFKLEDVEPIVDRITLGEVKKINLKCVKQDENLAKNQSRVIRCGDNGIFKGTVLRTTEVNLTKLMNILYEKYHSDGKSIACLETEAIGDLEKNSLYLTICQSKANKDDIFETVIEWKSKHITELKCNINPLGEWQGGLNVDSGATNRKLGSDMGGAVTGGGLHGKDLSKADVSLNIYAYLMAQEIRRDVKISCSIGDTTVKIADPRTNKEEEKKYSETVEKAHEYINEIGGFEKFAEWGLIRPKEKKENA